MASVDQVELAGMERVVMAEQYLLSIGVRLKAASLCHPPAVTQGVGVVEQVKGETAAAAEIRVCKREQRAKAPAEEMGQLPALEQAGEVTGVKRRGLSSLDQVEVELEGQAPVVELRWEEMRTP